MASNGRGKGVWVAGEAGGFERVELELPLVLRVIIEFETRFASSQAGRVQ